jgi:hypothetical protein
MAARGSRQLQLPLDHAPVVRVGRAAHLAPVLLVRGLRGEDERLLVLPGAVQRPPQRIRDRHGRVPLPLAPQPPHGGPGVTVVRLEEARDELGVHPAGGTLPQPGPRRLVLAPRLRAQPHRLVQLAQLPRVLGQRPFLRRGPVGVRRLRGPPQRGQRPPLTRERRVPVGIGPHRLLERAQRLGGLPLLPGQLPGPYETVRPFGRSGGERHRVPERGGGVLAEPLVPVHERGPRQHPRPRRRACRRQPDEPGQRVARGLVVPEPPVRVDQRRIGRPPLRRRSHRGLAPLPSRPEVVPGVGERGQSVERLHVPLRLRPQRRTQRLLGLRVVPRLAGPLTPLRIRRTEHGPRPHITRMGPQTRLAVPDQREQIGR